MFGGITKYVEDKNHQDIKKKMTKDTPERELKIVMQILKTAEYPVSILEHSKQNVMYPSWMNRMDTFDMLEMFASEFERGIYQKTEEIENTKRLIGDLEHAHDLLRLRERTVVNGEHEIGELRRRLSRALRKLDKEGISAEDEFGKI